MTGSEAALVTAGQRVADLEELLRRMRTARSTTPGLQRPAGAVGAAGSWTGTTADQLHGRELGPLAARFGPAMERAESAVLDALAQAHSSVGALRDRVAAEQADEARRAASTGGLS